MGTVITNAEGREIRRSRNLRGLLDHARREVPETARLEPSASDSWAWILTVNFANGDSAVSIWQDWTVCADWLAGRRAWPALRADGWPPFAARYQRARGLPLAPVYSLRVAWRAYACDCCGTVQRLQTNHTGPLSADCPGCNSRGLELPTTGSAPYAGHFPRRVSYAGPPVDRADLNPLHWARAGA